MPKARIVWLPTVPILCASAFWATHASAATTITFSNPAANAVLARGSDIRAEFHVSSDYAVKTIAVQLGKSPAVAIAPSACLSDATGLTCGVSLPTSGEPNGLNAIVVSTSDALALAGTATLPVVLDDPPTISGGSAAYTLFSGSTITVTCADTGVFGCAEIRLSSYDATGVDSVLATGTTSASFPTASLNGADGFSATATDTAGLTTTVGFPVAIDLTPGIVAISRVPGVIAQVNTNYILFTKPHQAGYFLRDRRTGVDTLLSATATAASLVKEGAIADEPAGGTGNYGSVTVYWAGTFLRTRAADALTNFQLGSSNVARDERHMVYSKAQPSGDRHLCYAMDLATGVESVVGDLYSLGFIDAYCDGIGVASNGDMYFGYSGCAAACPGPSRGVVRISAGVMTKENSGQGARLSAFLDPNGSLAFENQTSPGPFQLLYGQTPFGRGFINRMSDGHVLFESFGTGYNSLGYWMRKPDGTVVDRNYFLPTSTTNIKLGDGGEYGIGSRRLGLITQYLVSLAGTPGEVARGPGSLVPSSGGGWLLAQMDTLRCVRPPCGYSNVPSVGPGDAGANDAGTGDGDAGNAGTGNADAGNAAASDSGPTASASPTSSACSATGRGTNSTAALGIAAALAGLVTRRRRHPQARA